MVRTSYRITSGCLQVPTQYVVGYLNSCHQERRHPRSWVSSIGEERRWSRERRASAQTHRPWVAYVLVADTCNRCAGHTFCRSLSSTAIDNSSCTNTQVQAACHAIPSQAAWRLQCQLKTSSTTLPMKLEVRLHFPSWEMAPTGSRPMGLSQPRWMATAPAQPSHPQRYTSLSLWYVECLCVALFI